MHPLRRAQSRSVDRARPSAHLNTNPLERLLGHGDESGRRVRVLDARHDLLLLRGVGVIVVRLRLEVRQHLRDVGVFVEVVGALRLDDVLVRACVKPTRESNEPMDFSRSPRSVQPPQLRAVAPSPATARRRADAAASASAVAPTNERTDAAAIGARQPVARRFSCGTGSASRRRRRRSAAPPIARGRSRSGARRPVASLTPRWGGVSSSLILARRTVTSKTRKMLIICAGPRGPRSTAARRRTAAVSC